MGLAISVVELPLFYIYGTKLSLLHRFCPKKSFSGDCWRPEDAILITEDEWSYDSVKPGSTFLIEGSSKDGKSIYIEAVVHEKYVSATLILSDKEKSIGSQFTGPFVNDRTIQCGPLFLEMRSPFRLWRVSFKGYLSNDIERHFVTIAGWWKATSDARFFYSDLNRKNFKFSKTFEFNANLNRISSAHYSQDLSQFGHMYLEVGIDGETEEIRYRGVREQFNSNRTQDSDEFYVHMEDGNRVSFKSVIGDNHSFTVNNGYMAKSDLQVGALSLNDVDSFNESNVRLITFKTSDFRGPGRKVAYSLRKDGILNSYSYQSSSGHLVEVKHIIVSNENTTGVALVRVVRDSLHEIEEPVFNKLPEVIATVNERKASVVPFSLRSCQDKHFTGGKGANLARLKSIENKYTVPNGSVVTTTAFENFLLKNNVVGNLIIQLSTLGLTVEEYVAIGERVMEALKSLEPPQYLSKELSEAGVHPQHGVKFAVRSSAVGEDGSDLSSAGQLESVLNVEYDDIPKAILECWCSNFRKEVLTYRRTYGQILNPSMAVVVQEMVTNGVAGVMFTCDPVKNDEGKMVINAIFGCGEDIVSGVVTPDEIIVEKGTTLKINKPEKCCVDDATITNLANVGLFLEDMFGTAQDVEFVLRDGEVFIVQSRDVTGRDRETRFELLTEYDGASLTDREVYTTANVGEVVPVPQAPFEMSALGDVYEKSTTSMGFRHFDNLQLPRHFYAAYTMHGQRPLMNFGQLFLRQTEIIQKDRLAEISIAGSLIFTDDMFEEAKKRYPSIPKSFVLRRLMVMGDLIFFKSHKLRKSVVKSKEEMEALTPTSDDTFENLYDRFQKQRMVFRKVFSDHNDTSMFSSFTYVVVGALVRGSTDDHMSPDMLSDLANVFSNSTSNVLSADVPTGLKKLAKAIQEDGLTEEFCTAEGDTALEVVKKRGMKSAKQLAEFLKVYGHRGPKELYLRAQGWAEKPELLILTLKTMLSSNIVEKEGPTKSIDEVVDSLKCRPTGFKRWLIKYMVGECHRGVACREFAKNCLVKSVFEYRATTKMIAKHLYMKGLLPDEDLLFFMTEDEMLTLNATRSPKIIARAMRRRQIMSELEERQYAHVYHGNPEPVSQNLSLMSSDVVLKGTVVCEGRVVAKARVAKNLEEAKATQPGEILITRCTDICWSPFFPIIKGIVTEIGGLLSHGAVVAREYGLPSIIAVENATAVFQTGDLVELDSFKGTISKVEKISE